MKILVAVKSVPDPNALRFDASGAFAASTPRVVNDYDGYAIEEAIRIQESREGVEVTAVSVGPTAAKDAVTRALAMGADTGVLIVSDEADADSIRVASLLAEVARSDAYDLVLVGQESSDGATGNVGPSLAGLLGLPLVSNVVNLQIEPDGTFTLQREVEDGRQIVNVAPPVVICALTGLNEPRSPSLKGIMAARRKPVVERPVAEFSGAASLASWGKLWAETRAVQGTMITDDAETAAKRVVAMLKERGVV